MTSTAAPRLTQATLPIAAARGARIPAYDPTALSIGVVHFGPGAFFRAHQAEVYDRLSASGDPRWGVCGVSLRSPAVRDALSAQDGLYTLRRLSAEAPPQIIGVLQQVLVAGEQPGAVIHRLASPQTRVVALTVTEKGYHLNGAGDLALDDLAIAHDLASARDWRTPVAWLAAGLKRRRAEGSEPFLTLSCDNLSGNGSKLKRAVLTFVHARGETDLAEWINANALFPDSVVDSITPATDERLRTAVASELGLWDASPVQRESFSQWVIEDVDHPALESLRAAGVILTDDIEPFERMKLRLLNGAHTALAYLGLLLGLETVSEAMNDVRLAGFVERLMREDLAPTLGAVSAADGAAYIDAVLARFRDPGLRHRLSQIAMDGSVKLPLRLLQPAKEAFSCGLSTRRIALVVAAWMVLIVRAEGTSGPLEDPLAGRLRRIAISCSGRGSDVQVFLYQSGIFDRSFLENPVFTSDLVQAYHVLSDNVTNDGWDLS